MAAGIQKTLLRTHSLEEFKKEVVDKLNPDTTIIKYYIVSFTFFRIKSGHNQKPEIFAVNYKNPVGIPKDEKELYELLKNAHKEKMEAKTPPPSPEKYQFHKASLETLQKPLESPAVQRLLEEYRRSRREAPLAGFKEDLQIIPLQYRNVPDPKRLTLKSIQIIYLEQGTLEKEVMADYKELIENKCKKCAQMETSAHKLHKMCTRCHEVWYCDSECQAADLPNHAVTCLKS
jgi:hypothetical protein